MKFFISIFLFCCFYSAQAQKLSLETILIKTEQALSKIKNGYYEYQVDFKYLTSTDTAKTIGKFYFDNKNKAKKNIAKTNDEEGEYQYELFYNPKQGYYSLSPDDKKYWKDTVWQEQEKTEMTFYFKKSRYFAAKVLKDSSFLAVSQLSDTVINNKKCYRIKYSSANDSPFSDIYKIVSIAQKTFIPICWETHAKLDEIDDTQYTKLLVLNSNFNQKKYSKELAFRAIPANYTSSKDSIKPRRFLAVGDTLPIFSYQNLPNQNINLDNLSQEYMLLDFWYIGCYPCIQASTFVDTLATQYINKNLFVVGINTQDTSASKISEFKKKKNISYPNILVDYEAAKLLYIYAYPTFVIVERRSRKVVYEQKGFGEEMKQPLIDFIEKNVVK